MTESMNLRERNRLRARAEIAQEALRLFTERGFDAVTVDDIISGAGVSRRTFFRYFESKEDALLADYPSLRAVLDAAIGSVDENAPLASARATLHKLADHYIERRNEVLARSDVMRGSTGAAARNLRLLAEWEESIGGAIAASVGTMERAMLSRTSAVLIVASFRAALTEWIRSGAKNDLHRFVDGAFDLVENGLGAQFPDQS